MPYVTLDESVEQAASACGVGFDPTGQLLGVAQGCGGRHLSHLADAEGRLRFHQLGDSARLGDAKPHPIRGKGVNLRERAQDHHVGSCQRLRNGGCVGLIVDEVVISLVDNDQNLLGDRVDELVDGVGGDQGPGRVVGIGQVDDRRVIADSRPQRVEVMYKAVPKWDFDGL